MNKKVIIIAVSVLVALAGAYHFVLAKPEAKAEPKVEGNVYVLGKEFLVNLHGGHFAKLTAALVLSHDDTSTQAAEGEGAKPPEGFGDMPQEAVVRDIITDDLTGRDQADLIDRDKREKLKARIAKDLLKHTDVKVEDVLITDVTVQ